MELQFSFNHGNTIDRDLLMGAVWMPIIKDTLFAFETDVSKAHTFEG